MKKYELLEEFTIGNNKTVYRIKALKDFGRVKKDEKGGFVESEYNLSHEGDCWIFGNAKVYGKDKVEGNTLFFGS